MNALRMAVPGAVALAMMAGAQAPPSGIVRIENPAAGENDFFGLGMLRHEDRLVVTAPYDDPGGVTEAGSIYTFSLSDGALLESLPNPDPGAFFGSVIAVVGTTHLAVGAGQNDPGGIQDSGMVYLLDGATLDTIVAIPNPSGLANEYFGESAIKAVAGNFVAGCTGHDAGGFPQAGIAYLFDAQTGSLVDVVDNPAPSANDFFGGQIVVVGTNFVVATPNDNVGLFNQAGSVHLFDGASGSLISTIPNPEAGTGEGFGQRVTRVGTNRFVVSEPGDFAGGFTNAGSVHLYDGVTGAHLVSIENPVPGTNDNFGQVVAAVGDGFAVSAPSHNLPGYTRAGMVHLFDGDGVLVASIPNPGPDGLDSLGMNVIVDVGKNFVVAEGEFVGEVHLFDGTTGAVIRSIPNPDPFGGRFGDRVATVGTNFVVNAYANDPGNVENAGTAYLFDGTTGDLIAALPNPAAAAADAFGFDGLLALGNDFAVASTRDGAGGFAGAGSVYLFRGHRAPVPGAQSLTTPEEASLPITLTGSDPDGGPLLFAVVSASNGTVTGDAPDIAFLPSADFNGMASIVFRVTDGIGATATGVIDVDVTPVNDAPIASDDVTAHEAGSEVTVDVLANDSDIDGDTLQVTDVAGPDHAEVTIVPGGIRYRTDVPGTETIAYSISDGAITASATLTVTSYGDGSSRNGSGDGGCGCSLGATRHARHPLGWLGVLAIALAWRRRMTSGPS